MIQEWFYNHPWSYWMYWILFPSVMYYPFIFMLKLIFKERKLIIRLPPDGWVIADESKQGLRSREVKEMTNREMLIEWGYDQNLIETMSDEDCEGEVEAVEMYPEG